VQQTVLIGSVMSLILIVICQFCWMSQTLPHDALQSMFWLVA